MAFFILRKLDWVPLLVAYTLPGAISQLGKINQNSANITVMFELKMFLNHSKFSMQNFCVM